MSRDRPVPARQEGRRANPAVRAEPRTEPAGVESLLELQRTAGNRAVSTLLGAPVVQRDLLDPTSWLGDIGATAKAVLDAAAILDVQSKLKTVGVADGKGFEVAVPQTGVLDAGTVAAIKAYQGSHGLPVTGTITAELKKALDGTITTVDKTWGEKIRGISYGMTSKYDYQVTDQQVHVRVKFKFAPTTRFDVSPHAERWFKTIRDQWNIFKVVNADGSKSRDIVFEPMSVTSGEHNTVSVVNGTGTNDGGTWYTTYSNGEAQNNLGAAHEFGHHLGLPDEYGQSHPDYRKNTGEEPFPATDPLPAGADAAAVATKIKDALALAAAADRATTLTTLYADKSVTAGRYAVQISDAYKAAAGTDLVDDLYAKLPEDKRGALIEPFVATAGGLMGSRYKSMKAPGSTDSAGHEHPLAPRHMAPFVGYVTAALGGTWKATFK